MHSEPTETAVIKPLRSLVTATFPWALAVVCLLATACIPEKSCAFTKTCPDPTADASIDTSKAPDRTSAPGDVTLDSNVPDANVESPLFKCTRSTHCPSELPYCDQASERCTGCRTSDDCQNPEARYCATFPDAPETNRCVECLPEDNTCDKVCVDFRCAQCDPADNAGCDSDSAPHCVDLDGELTCVECATNRNCSSRPGKPYCSDNKCKSCSVTDPSSCPADIPVCFDEGPRARCVECFESSQCPAAEGEVAVCIEEQCTRCVLGSNEGCFGSTAYCAVVITTADGGIDYFTPDASTTNQYLEFDHDCVQCLNDSHCSAVTPNCVRGRCTE